MAVPNVREIAAFNNVESPPSTPPIDMDIRNDSNTRNASPILAQPMESASPSLLNNGESPRPPMRPTVSNSNTNNSNSGNQNSIITGGTSIDASDMFVATAGRDLILNFNVNSAQQVKDFLEPSTFKETSRKDLNNNISGLETLLLQDPDLSVPNPTPSAQQIDSPTIPSMQKSTSASTESSINPPVYDYTTRDYPKSLASLTTKSQMKRITRENLKRHIPAVTNDSIVDYMCSPMFFGSTIAIPLWRPSPSVYDSIANHTQNWTRNTYLGDVGVFDNDGGFTTYFNIFESKESNRNRGRAVPDSFIPYYKKLSEMSIESSWHSDPAHTLRVIGFTKDETSEGNESVTLRFPIRSTKHGCSALYMRDGFRCLRIPSDEEAWLQEFIIGQQAGWYNSWAKILGGRYLTIITTSYRVKAWALAITEAPPKGVGRVRLLHREVEQQQIYSWAPEDDEVLTRNGPSVEHIQKIGAYLRTLADGSELVRKELEECHVVAVEGFYLHEKTSRGLGRSFRTNHTNKSEQTITQRVTAWSQRKLKSFLR